MASDAAAEPGHLGPVLGAQMVDLDWQLDWLRDAPMTSDDVSECARVLDPEGSSLTNESIPGQSHSMTLSLFVDGDSRECGLEGGYRSLGAYPGVMLHFVLILSYVLFSLLLVRSEDISITLPYCHYEILLKHRIRHP